MRDLIKRILREEVDKKDLETKIRKWMGDSEAMKDLWIKVRRNEPMSDEEYILADKFFKDELIKRGKSDNTIGKKLRTYGSGVDQRNKIIELGKDAYLDLIKTDLSIFFNNIFNPKLKLKIGKPNDAWFKTNYNDLVNFNSDIKQWENNRVPWVEGVPMTIKEKIEQLKYRLYSKDFDGILESETWSILNKLDTHYTFWGDEITKRQRNNDLPMGHDISIIENYFTPKPLESVLPKKWKESFNKLKKEKNLNINSMSFAHVDLLEKFHEEKEHEFEEMKEKIRITTNKGDNAERDFKELIKNYPNQVQNIKEYTTWGNVIDMVFGVDLTAKFSDGFKVIQVKSSKDKASGAFIKKLGIPYLSVYPMGKKQNVLNFNYFSENSKTEPKNFNDDFINTSKNIEPDLNYKEKEKNALEKTLGTPQIDDYFRKSK